MKYNFPKITHIDQVLPVIEGKTEYIVAERDGYKVINYVVAAEDTFPEIKTEEDAILRECRGLIFNEDGSIMSRRFHKFFNLNEREETHVQNIDFSKPHIILEKLDGSMSTPIFIGDCVRWGTKMGVTEVAFPVEEFVASRPEYKEFAKICRDTNATPIFEWCSRKQRIVIDHPEDQLILTAVRNNETGEYIRYPVLKEIGDLYNIPVVKAFQSNVDDIHKFVDELSKMENTEGVVVRFDDGHMIKIKTDWYVKIHRAKDILSREHDVAQLILENKLDDLKPLLLQEDLNRLIKFENDFIKRIEYLVNRLYDESNVIVKQLSRKEFALNSDNIEKWFRSWVFAMWDNPSMENANKIVIAYVLSKASKMSAYAELKNDLLKGIDYD